MTFEEAAAIVIANIQAKPDYAAKLNKAIADFEESAEYRMEVASDVLALEIMGQMLARTIGDADLSNRSNCAGTEMRGGIEYIVTPKASDLIHAFCDHLGHGAEIVRFSAFKAMEG